MADVILHHYPLSFFAEKVRRVLAYKKIPWRSVEQPMMAPKPDLTALTGGYRRIPVLQIGADVYCDTECIVRRLERLRPEPVCIPRQSAGLIELVEDWADHRFTSQVAAPVIVDILPNLPPGILTDRAAMSPMLSEAMLRQVAPHAFTQALLSLDRLERQLRDRPFLLGDAFTLADAACFHPVWFARQSPRLAAAVDARPALAAWFARVEDVGAGESTPLRPDEALAIARDAAPADVGGGELTRRNGWAVGDRVAIAADDYGPEESRGTIVRLAPDEVTTLRQEPALGEIAVHFPRAGYRIRKES
jgi:glutathione S-transferase